MSIEHPRVRSALKKRGGFTLVEIMIVVAIIGLLAAIAIPSFAKARNEAKVSSFLNDVRLIGDYLEQYAMDTGNYPADRNAAETPDGSAEYLKSLDWTEATPAGGQWDWDYNVFGLVAGISVVNPNHDMMVRADARMDDGNLATGAFRQLFAGRYTHVLEE